MKTACVMLADGFEEVEALTPIDYLRRAGVKVTVLGLTGTSALGGHDIRVEADLEIGAGTGEYDCVVVPGGGGGSKNIAANAPAVALIKRHFAAGKLVAAICAAPAVVLHEACGILKGRRFTGYPGTESRVTGAKFSEDRVVDDGNLLTSRAAGCAGEFSLAIVEKLVGKAEADELAAKLLM
jgi:4-methyl-5(b-hydroxyethyl)-thiazole monophosphate biosynthesis